MVMIGVVIIRLLYAICAEEKGDADGNPTDLHEFSFLCSMFQII